MIAQKARPAASAHRNRLRWRFVAEHDRNLGPLARAVAFAADDETASPLGAFNPATIAEQHHTDETAVWSAVDQLVSGRLVHVLNRDTPNLFLRWGDGTVQRRAAAIARRLNLDPIGLVHDARNNHA